MRAVLILGLFLVSAVTAQAGDILIVKQSKHNVTETLDRLAKIMQSKGITIFARVNHTAGAKKVGLKMLPTELLIFGNPKMGTPLMLSNRAIGIDLPLKALAWRDKDGKVWLGYTKPSVLKSRHGIADRDPVFKKMTGALDKLTTAAVN